MFYNYLRSPSISKSMQTTFYGLNKNARIGDGEFSDMTNMSGDYAPLLSPRAVRTVVQKNAEGNTLNGILGDAGFCAVCGGDFYYMGKKVEGVSLTNGEKTLLAMGAQILIYPDAVYYNTETGEYGKMETGLCGKKIYLYRNKDMRVFLEGEINTLPCEITARNTGNVIKSCGSFDTDGDMYDVSIRFGELKDTSNSAWYAFDNVAEMCVYNGELYYIYSGTAETENQKLQNVTWRKVPVKSAGFYTTLADMELSELQLEKLWLGNTHVTCTESSDGYLYFNGHVAFGLIDAAVGSEVEYICGDRIVEKNLPTLDHVCVHDNRLWGCRYGAQVTGNDVNEIYCSALGDFKRWETGTLAGDPYAVSVGEYGAFTGCVSLRGNLLFFKDDVVYRVIGDKPSNFQIDKISESGLQSGCEKSLETIDGVLYYKSRNGVYVYDGSVPQKISDALGNFYYTDAVAGKHFQKYYISMVHDGVRKLYVYDTRTGLWHAEDNVNVRFFTEYEGALYAVAGNEIVCLSGSPAEFFGETEAEGAVKWSVETGDIGLDSPYQKYFHRILLRMEMEFGARVTVELQCDSGAWLQAADFTASRKQSFLMPIVSPRCDHIRMRIRGSGDVKIYSISYETETVGDKP